MPDWNPHVDQMLDLTVARVAMRRKPQGGLGSSSCRVVVEGCCWAGDSGGGAVREWCVLVCSRCWTVMAVDGRAVVVHRVEAEGS